MSGIASRFKTLLVCLLSFAYRINPALELACHVESLLSCRCELYRHNVSIDVIAYTCKDACGVGDQGIAALENLTGRPLQRDVSSTGDSM
jgi:hypothetical protein